MKCQRQTMKIRWQDHTRNTEVALLTGLCPVLDLVTRRRNAVFGHIARLSEDTPAYQALRCHVDLSLGRFPDQGWRRRPGRPSNRWIDQVLRANNTPSADLWRRSIARGHSERRYGPCRLRVNDDDDDTVCSVRNLLLIGMHTTHLLCRYTTLKKINI